MSKVEANDVMHSAGGGNGTGAASVGGRTATIAPTTDDNFYNKQQISQSNTASNSNEHANNNSAPVSSSYHQLHSQSHTTTAHKDKTAVSQQQPSLDKSNTTQQFSLPPSHPQTVLYIFYHNQGWLLIIAIWNAWDIPVLLQCAFHRQLPLIQFILKSYINQALVGFQLHFCS